MKRTAQELARMMRAAYPGAAGVTAGVKMFCGELHGRIEPTYLDFRAGEVRRDIAVMFDPGKPTQDAWKIAQREGWKVVPCVVKKLER